MSTGNTIAIAANTDGRLEGFVTRADGSLWHAWETASGEWSPWRVLRHDGVADFAVARLGSGLAVAAIAYDTVVATHQDPSAPGGWAKWESLAGSPMKRIGAVDVGGAFGVAGLDPDGNVYSCIRDRDGSWPAWRPHDLGGCTELCVMTGLSGTATVLVVGDGGIVSLNPLDPEVGWVPVGEAASRVPIARVAGAWTGDDHLHVFGLAADGTVHHVTDGANRSWGAWTQLGAQKLSSLSAARNADGRLEVFGLADGHIAHAWQVADDRWSSWGSIPTPNTPLARLAVSPPDASGHLNLLGASADDQTWRAQQGESRTGWTPWAHVAGVMH